MAFLCWLFDCYRSGVLRQNSAAMRWSPAVQLKAISNGGFQNFSLCPLSSTRDSCNLSAEFDCHAKYSCGRHFAIAGTAKIARNRTSRQFQRLDETCLADVDFHIRPKHPTDGLKPTRWRWTGGGFYYASRRKVVDARDEMDLASRLSRYLGKDNDAEAIH